MLLLSRGPKIVVISKDGYALARCGGVYVLEDQHPQVGKILGPALKRCCRRSAA